jgi:hypothetical protein
LAHLQRDPRTVAQLVQKEHLVALPAHEQRLGGGAASWPGLDQGVEVIEGRDAERQQPANALVGVADRRNGVEVDLPVCAAEQVTERRCPAGESARDRFSLDRIESGRVRILPWTSTWRASA